MGGSSSSNNISPLDLVNIRRIAWDLEREEKPKIAVNEELVEMLTRKIMEKLK